jgi:hypothetical protein
MRQRLGLLFFGLAILFGQTLAQRAEADESSPMRTFLASPYYASLIHTALGALPPDEFRQCPGLVSNGSNVMVLRPVTFDESGFPGSGLWRQSFPVSGCGNDTIVNFYLLPQPGKKISVLIGVPGSTIANLLLQGAGKKFTTIAAQRVAPGCQSFTVINTLFEGFLPLAAGAPPATRPWRESWTLAGCGQRYTVPIQFAPNKAGTQVTLPNGVISDR